MEAKKNPAAGNDGASEGTDEFYENETHSTTDFGVENEIIGTANQEIARVTFAFLDSLAGQEPPTAEEVETQLVNATGKALTDLNARRKQLAGLSAVRLPASLTPWQVAQVLIRREHAVVVMPSSGGDPKQAMLAVYADEGAHEGTYRAWEDDLLRAARRYHPGLTEKEFVEVCSQLRSHAPRVAESRDPDLVAVANGVFDYRTKTLMPFDPGRVFLSKSAVSYVPDAPNPVIHHEDGTEWDVESWMAGLSDDPEVVELLWECLSAVVRPHVRWGRAVFLVSEKGNNGKGTWLTLARRLVGQEHYASVSLADFARGEFLLEPLVNANAVLVDENDVGGYVDKAADFKAVVTHDEISINRKGEKVIRFRARGLMVQCLNELPRFKDKSDSLYRRLLLVPFTKCFTGAERRYIKEDYLARTDVLQYVLHRVLHMEHCELREPDACRALLTDAKEHNDPVREFWAEFEDQFVWTLLPRDFLWTLFSAWFRRTNPSGRPVGRSTFLATLRVIAVEETGRWVEKSIRSGRRLDAPEPLIAEYDLPAPWVNPAYTYGPDVARRCTITPKESYRGLLRVEDQD